MPSPFPGMDPYLEAPERWQDVHADLAAEIQTALNRRIQPRYFARMGSSLAYEEEVPVRLHRVEIRTTGVEELVTVIEILSPANKRHGHETHGECLRKRRALLRSSVHLLEIDLLRAAERPPLEGPVPDAPYYVMLSRAEYRPEVQVWPVQLAERLPEVPVPLVEPDPDVPLDVNAVLASVYERGAYSGQIDYRQPPPPPRLSDEAAAWTDALLHEKGIRERGASEQD